MDTQKDLIEAARRASGLTQDGAAAACGLARQTYRQREDSPGDFRVSELLKFFEVLTPLGQSIFKDWLDSLFLSR